MRMIRVVLTVILAASVAQSVSFPASVRAQPTIAPAGGGQLEITVTTPDDQFDDDSLPASANTKCSLREAVDLAHGSGDRGCGAAGLDTYTHVTIKFFAPTTYKLTRPEQLEELGSGKVILITGPGVFIDGGKGLRNTGIFIVDGDDVHLEYLTLKNGSREFGGAVWVQSGTLTVSHVKFELNGWASGAQMTTQGGAIHIDGGDLDITDSQFVNNAASLGGAISTAVGKITKTKFISNQAQGGGALYIHTQTTFPVRVIDSTFKDNRAERQGGFPGGWQPSDDDFGGGAILNNGYLRLVKTLVQGNTSDQTRGGAGLVNDAGAEAELEDCAFTQNVAKLQQGVEHAWGGAILNGGQMYLKRCSIHGNEAYYAGGIYNGYAGDLDLFNTTIANNTANQYGGLVNGHSDFGALPVGATVELYFSSLGDNSDSSSPPNQLKSWVSHSVWFASSVLAGGCSGVQYTYGRSVMGGPCNTIPDPQNNPQNLVDVDNVLPADLGLQGLMQQGGPVAQFMVQRIAADSSAVDIGREDGFGCTHTQIAHLDQLQNQRPVNGCDAGAYEAGSAQPGYTSNPGVGAVYFPGVDFTLGQTESFLDLVIQNPGGGAMTYKVVDRGGQNYDESVTLLSAAEGTLFKNGSVTLSFKCEPPLGYVDVHWKYWRIETNVPGNKENVYLMRCTGSASQAQANPSQPAGPNNLDGVPPGQTANGTLIIENPGHEPLQVEAAYRDTLPAFTLGTSLASQAQGLTEAPALGPFVVNPGQSLQFNISCTPPTPGLFVNTLDVTTSDINQPILSYPTACEGLVVSPPEQLEPGMAYAVSPHEIAGLAVSPEGNQILAGAADDQFLRTYVRESTGDFFPNLTTSAPGMSQIMGVVYSQDGKNVYYTSRVGDGVVVVRRNGFILTQQQVLTRSTLFICGPFFFCPFDTMDGAYGVAVSPDDGYVYVSGYNDGSLTVFYRNRFNGSLTMQQRITSTVTGAGVMTGASRLAVSPDGQHLYVIAETADTLVVFQRTSNGSLTFQGFYKDGVAGLTTLNHPGDVVVSSDGAYVYVSSVNDNAINHFQRNAADGSLTRISAVTGITDAWGLALSPDPANERLFVTQYVPDSMRVYGRDAASGALTLVDIDTHVPISSNIDSPLYVAVSPDNESVYLGLYNGQAIRLLKTLHHAPVVTHISPASVPAGSAAFILTVRGGRFYPTSQVLWNGSPIGTTYVDEHELQATIPAASVSAIGPANVAVRTPAAGGGDSAPVTFQAAGPADPPVPSIESLDPSEISSLDEPLLITIIGANFGWESQVTYNGQPVPTYFFDSHMLKAELSVEVLQAPGTGGLAVTNVAPPAGALQTLAPAAVNATATSAIVAFTVVAGGAPAQPTLSSLSPASVLSGTAGVWVSVTGFNFSTDVVAESVGYWDGQPRGTVVLDEHALLMFVEAGDLVSAGNHAVTVRTPGTDESSPLQFRVLLPGEKPVPVLTAVWVDPASLTLFVYGSDFAAGATIAISGQPRATSFIDSGQLSTPLSVTDVGGSVVVTNLGPGGGPSQFAAFLFRRLMLPLIFRQ